jgi:hypothetical protein
MRTIMTLSVHNVHSMHNVHSNCQTKHYINKTYISMYVNENFRKYKFVDYDRESVWPGVLAYVTQPVPTFAL